MEQLFEAFGVNTQLLISQRVNFGILFVALTWLLYKPVMKTLDERRAKIAKGVEDAELATAKLAGADEEVSRRVHLASTEAEGIMASAREQAATEKAKIMKDAETRAAQVALDADLRAKEAAAQALKESEKEVARLAVLAAEKVLRKS